MATTHVISIGILIKLEEGSNLPVEALDFLKNQFCGKDRINMYAGILDVLNNGYAAWNKTYKLFDRPRYRVTDSTLRKILSLKKQNYSGEYFSGEKFTKQFKDVLVNTPGWKQMTNNGELEEPPEGSKYGFLGFEIPTMPNSPVTGNDNPTPPLCEQLLNKIHPDFTKNTRNFCKLIKSRAYLALPAMAFGSLQSVVNKLNGVVKAFQRIINDIYQGCIRIIQQFYSYINGLIQQIQRWMVWIIEQIIPLDLICLILEAAQILLDDIFFFTSLFSQSGSIFNYLNQFQNYINIASDIVYKLYNPLTTIISYLPPQVKQVIDLVDQIGTDPDGYISDQLSNYGMGYVATALQGNIVAALIDKFGPQYRAIGPISQFINSSGLTVPPAYYPPYSVGSAWKDGSSGPVDNMLNPISGTKKIIDNTFKKTKKNISNLGTAIGGAGTSLSNLPSNLVNGVKNYPTLLKDVFNDPDNANKLIDNYLKKSNQ